MQTGGHKRRRLPSDRLRSPLIKDRTVLCPGCGADGLGLTAQRTRERVPRDLTGGQRV